MIKHCVYVIVAMGSLSLNIVRAMYGKTQEVHGERKDMVERERGQDMIAFPHVVAAETKELRHVHDQIAVRLTPVVPPVYCRHAMADGSKPLI
jgi:hypothetical protein